MARTYDIKAMAVEVNARARKAQGLPETIEDPAVLDQLAALLYDPEPMPTASAS